MEKKRSVGIMSVALIMLIYSISCLFIWQKESASILNPANWIVGRLIGFPGFDAVIYLITGIFILMQRNWARKLALAYSIIMLLLSLPVGIQGIFHPVVFQPGNFFVTCPDTLGVTECTPESPFTLLLVVSIVYIPILLYILFIYFFTRPKVKEQFK